MTQEERNEMGKKGYDFVKKYHNFDYLSDLYIEVFNS
jgi:spore maturation protein CgeB